VTDLRCLDQVELLGEGVGVDPVAEFLRVDRELTGARPKSPPLPEVVAEPGDVELPELQRVRQRFEGQIVVVLRHVACLAGVALGEKRVEELDGPGQLAGVAVGTATFVAARAARLELGAELGRE
jgi:hypothetical protein